MRLFNVLPNFPFTSIETMGDYYEGYLFKVYDQYSEELHNFHDELPFYLNEWR